MNYTSSGGGFYRDGAGVYILLGASSRWMAGRTFWVGDQIKNSSTGDVYLCTKTMVIPKNVFGKTRTNEWKYLRTDIVKRPSTAVTNLAITKKNDLTFQITWKVPSEATNAQRNDRATWANVVVTRLGPQKTPSYLFRNNIDIKTTSLTVSLRQSELYPLWGIKTTSIHVEVRLSNAYGTALRPGRNGELVGVINYNIQLPRIPDAFGIAQDANTGVLSTTIKTNAGTDAHSRYDTRWTISVYRSQTKKTESISGNNTATSFAISKDIPDRQQIPYGHYIRTTFSAYARGIMGDSPTRSAQYVMSFPNIPTVAVPKLTRTPNSGRAVFNIKVNANGNFPVTGVRFQKLVSVEYSSAAEIPANANWQNVGPQDNGSCTAMSIAVEDLLPSAGTKTWVRVKTWNAIESIFYRYSNPIRLNALEIPAPVEPSAADDNATILSCSVGADGKSARLHIGWARVGGKADDSNWTEISWAESERAWRSTDQPETFTFADATWNEGQVTYGGYTYAKSAHIDVMGLESGVTYFISARRVLIPEDGETTYGPYCTKKKITMLEEAIVPETVTMTSDRDVIRGDSLPLSWSYDGDAPQMEWSIRKMNGSVPSASDVVLAKGFSERKFYNLSYYRNSARTSTIASSTATYINLYVECRVAGIYVRSEPITVNFLDKPTFEIATADKVITQPAIVNVFSNITTATASLVIESMGVSRFTPDGNASQSNGDTIWSGTVTPTWHVVSSIASQSEVQQAKTAMDAAQEDYDEVMGQYEDAKGRRDAAQASISVLTDKISNENRDLSDAQADLTGYQTRLDNMDDDDPMYEQAVTDVNEATEKVSSLQASLADDTQALTEAETALSQAQDDMDGIDYTDEQEALESATDAYAKAVSDAIGPSTNTGFTYRASIELPEGLDLLDNGRYRVKGFVTNPRTNVSSDYDETEFSVALAHQAPAPSSDIKVFDYDETDENGFRTLGTRIELPEPTRAYISDVYDLYRVSRDGTQLALRDIPFDSTVNDQYAPFGINQNGYIVACRTNDGDIDWLSCDYMLQESETSFHSMVRIDWNGKYVELERNVNPSDSFEKDFITHKHLDGSVSGHWNKGVMRTMNITAAFIRGYEVEQEELLRELARYDGSCLVRTTDGVFVEGNVSVDSIGFNNRSVKGDVSLTITEISQTGTFAPTIVEE